MLVDLLMPKMPVEPQGENNNEGTFGWFCRKDSNKMIIDLGKEDQHE